MMHLEVLVRAVAKDLRTARSEVDQRGEELLGRRARGLVQVDRRHAYSLTDSNMTSPFALRADLQHMCSSLGRAIAPPAQGVESKELDRSVMDDQQRNVVSPLTERGHQEFDVVCLGGGVAGEAIAVGLQGSGLTLAVVERELVGGECPYWGCVPSKTLLRSGETLTEADRARVLAASRVDWNIDFPKVSTRVLWMARNLDDRRPAAAMEATGARLFRGEGKLTDPRTIAVGGEEIVARRAVVIANGSTAAIPAIPGLDKVEFWTNRQAAIPTELPVSLAILGGGAIGVELGQAFARLGCRVQIIEAGPTFLGLEEPEAGAALRPHLEADGIMLSIGDPCVAVEQSMMGPSRERSSVVVHLKSGATVRADRLLVATGRRPNMEAWRAAGLAQTERGWLKVDPSTLEAQPGVFGAGDVTGLGGFTHLAYYHGQIVARRLRGMNARADHTAVPRVTFTDPEVASVGLSEAAARAKGIDVVAASADPAETARGYIHDFHRGTLKLVADRERGVLIGATLVTPRAGEILGELVLAIKLGTPLKTLADVIHPFPAFNRMLGQSLEELAAKVEQPSMARL